MSGSHQSTESSAIESGAQLATLMCILAVYLQAGWEGNFAYTAWTDRDLVRGLHMWERFEASGAELSGGPGARIPGPVNTLSVGIPLTFSPSAWGVYFTAVLGALASHALMFRLLDAHHGRRAAVFATALVVGSGAWWSSMAQLWNPAFIPLWSVGVLWAVHRLVVQQDHTAWPWLVGMSLAGGQIHLSVLLCGLAACPMAWWARPGFTRADAYRSVAVALALYAPYLLEEMTNGWHNTQLLGLQDAFNPTEWGQPRSGRAMYYLQALLRTSTDVMADVGIAWWARALCVVAGLGAIVSAAWERHRGQHQEDALRQRESWFLLTCGVVCALVLGCFIYDATLPLAERYLVALLPWIFLPAAVALNRLHAHMGARTAQLSGAVVCLLLTLPALQRLAHHRSATPWDSLAHLGSVLSHISDATGWSLTEIAGKTVAVRHLSSDRQSAWFFHPSLHFVLNRDGQTFPGSLTGPCGILVAADGLPDDPMAREDWLRRIVRRELPTPAIQSVVTLPRETALITYDPGDRRCPVSMTTRYLLTEAERVIATDLLEQPCTTPRFKPHPLEGGKRLVVSLPTPQGTLECGAFGLAVDLVQSSEGVHAVLHSNQLRGETSNSGPMGPQRLEGPKLVFESLDTDASHELVFEHGLVGVGAALTPLHAAPFALPAGVWRVRLVARRYHLEKSTWPHENAPSEILDLEVMARWEVSDGA